MFRCRALPLLAMAALVCSLQGSVQARAQAVSASAASAQEEISVNADAPAKPFPHFWEKMFGSGRANLVMRADYQKDLRTVKRVTDFRYGRFHAILDDENDVYSESAQGQPVYNWSYVDHIYDALLANG